jgi:hypothetical protein
MTRSRPTIARPGRKLIFLLIAITLSVGCHRQFYRKQADLEAYCLIDEKASHVARPPNVKIRVEVDPRSRMFNPFDLDFQPMPLDDPNSYRYMQCVDGRRGYPMWEAAGITNTAENPEWWQFLPLDEDGVLVLNSENAFRLALLHSPQYQREVEELYLAALDVTAERFVFETQFFGGAASHLNVSNGSTKIGFADGFPLLVTTSASLEDFNKVLSHPVRMDRFRPNIVVEGAEAWEEDEWSRARVGDVELCLLKPCGRCPVVDIDQESGRLESSHYGRRYELNVHPVDRKRNEEWQRLRQRAAEAEGEQAHGV